MDTYRIGFRWLKIGSHFFGTGTDRLPMNNIDLNFYFMILKRRLPLVLAIAFVVSSIAVVATRFMQPIYTATARLLVEAPQIPTDLAKSTVPMSATAQLMILQQEMTTHGALVDLASKLNIYGGLSKLPPEEDIVADLRDRIEFRQLELDGQDPLQGVAVYAISFDAERPDLAADVTNEMVTMILTKNQRERTVRAGNTVEFFDQKVVDLDQALNKIEGKILQFKKDNRESLPESLEYSRSELISHQERQASLDKEGSELRARRNALVAAYTATDRLPGVEQQLTPDQQLLVDLNRALSEQLTIFNENSPNIQAMRTRIGELQKRILASRRPVEVDKKTSRKDVAPFGLDLQLAEIDDRLKAIAEERATIDKRVASLREAISQAPVSEAALASLLRNRENLQKQYNAAIGQRAEASTGEQLEIRSDGGRFSLLEAAIAPTKAAGPKRRLIVLGGAAAGLGMGIGLAVLLELLNKTVRRPQDITNLLQAEPLATIPVVRTAASRKTWRPAKPAPALTAVLAIACALLSSIPFDRPIASQPGFGGHDAARIVFRRA